MTDNTADAAATSDPTANWSFETKQVHAGQTADTATNARASADLPDHQLRLRQHRSRCGTVRPRRAGQHLHADHESHTGRRRAAHRCPRRPGSPHSSSPRVRPPRPSRSSTSPRPATTSSPARTCTAARTTSCITPFVSWASKSRSSRIPTISSSGAKPFARTRRRSTAKRSPIRRTTSSTYPVSRHWPTRTVFR